MLKSAWLLFPITVSCVLYCQPNKSGITGTPDRRRVIAKNYASNVFLFWHPVMSHIENKHSSSAAVIVVLYDIASHDDFLKGIIFLTRQLEVDGFLPPLGISCWRWFQNFHFIHFLTIHYRTVFPESYFITLINDRPFKCIRVVPNIRGLIKFSF